MAPPLGVTPNLVVGFYGLFLVIWTLPTSLLVGLAVGFALRLTVRRYGGRVLSSWRTRLLVSLSYGLLLSGGFYLIFSHLWTNGVGFVALGVAFGAGVAMALFLTSSRAVVHSA
ncbi:MULTISPECIES: hypothetical protein [unclassified Leifsonia]|uniref:hypothetical protein n=1 Tax=unclassified Leifsonia TaxID=2663824 RepID=UPI0012FD0E31|nr:MULTISPECIES: hypothetical protein [unclassified Leifsonia]